jgi:hypothetical protein
VIEDFTVVVHEDVMAADEGVHHGPGGLSS